MKLLFNRFFGRAEPLHRADPLEPSAVENLRAHIERDVASGFYDEDAILTSAIDCLEGEIDAVALRTTAQRVLKAALAEHRLAQRGWPTVTDCDRLDAAFAELEADGIVARQNFSCCGTCGATEIWDEVSASEAAGGVVRGYAFYHIQDTESAVDGHGLHLNYGAVDEGETAALAVAQAIVAELEAHGLNARWNGSWGQRIGVDLDWKRRRA